HNAVNDRDTVERLPRNEQLIASLDVEPQSLEIEATIIDVNVDKARDLGINWRWSNDGRSAAFGGATPLPGAAGVASVVLGSVGQFFARIRALQSEGAARVVSSPQVVTLSNVEAIFDNSSTFYVRVAGRNDVDLFNVSAGTSLRVTPHVFRDSAQTRIKLLVNVEDGNISGRQVDQIPVVERSTINTQALIAEGESLLIGGMVRETTSQSVDKVPGLGDVPVLGHLFKNTNSGTVRVERMFLITPRLAGTRTAPPQTTLGVQRAGATPLDGVREPLPVGRAATAAPARMPLPLAPVAPMPLAPATPLPAPGPRQATAPAAVVAPKPRSSAVIDLDALPRGAPAAAPSRPAPAGTGPIAYRTALTQR
ncbi:MAG: type III secretion system outer membrane ring subunit SctC, partial [Lautropia sp.]